MKKSAFVAEIPTKVTGGRVLFMFTLYKATMNSAECSTLYDHYRAYCKHARSLTEESRGHEMSQVLALVTLWQPDVEDSSDMYCAF